jgi:hypothetical protein
MSRLLLVVLLSASVAPAQTILFGNQTVESGVDYNAAGVAQAWPLVASASGQLSSLLVYADSGSNASSGQVGIYTNASGYPRTLLFTTTLTNPRGNGWITIPVNPPVAIASGATYWIAILGTGSGLFKYRDRRGTTNCSNGNSAYNLTALPATWSAISARWGSCPLSVYGTTAATAPPPVTVAISPSSATVNVGGTQQFTATVTGTNNTSVVWTFSPAAFGVSSTGLFTAPSSPGTVTATSVADPTKSASVTITLGQPPIQHLVSLLWDASPTPNVNYNVYRSTRSGGPYGLLTDMNASTTFDDISVSPMTTYFYAVSASDGIQESVFTPEARAVIP